MKTIEINFTGLPRVLCQIGIHNWFDDEGFNREGQRIVKVCIECGKEKVRSLSQSK